MLLNVKEISPDGLTVEFEAPAAGFPSLKNLTQSGVLDFTRPVALRVRAQEVGEMIHLEMALQTTVTLACSRCLTPYQSQVNSRFQRTFSREVPEVYDEGGGEALDITAEEMGVSLFEGDEIDLRDEVQEQVVMALPMRPLCRDACQGLCANCGRDLNLGECGCDRSDPHHPFAALKNLKL